MKKFKENFMKTNNEIEKILLNDEEYVKLVSSKIEKDFENVLNEKTSQNPEIITEISKVPQEATRRRRKYICRVSSGDKAPCRMKSDKSNCSS